MRQPPPRLFMRTPRPLSTESDRREWWRQRTRSQGLGCQSQPQSRRRCPAGGTGRGPRAATTGRSSRTRHFALTCRPPSARTGRSPAGQLASSSLHHHQTPGKSQKSSLPGSTVPEGESHRAQNSSKEGGENAALIEGAQIRFTSTHEQAQARRQDLGAALPPFTYDDIRPEEITDSWERRIFDKSRFLEYEVIPQGQGRFSGDRPASGAVRESRPSDQLLPSRIRPMKQASR
jgi:hypothetical protein